MSQTKIDLLVRPQLSGAQVAQVVRHMLKIIPTTRNDVSRLFAHVLKYEWEARTNLDTMNTTAFDFLDALANNKLTDFTSVKSAMEIIQREQPELLTINNQTT